MWEILQTCLLLLILVQLIRFCSRHSISCCGLFLAESRQWSSKWTAMPRISLASKGGLKSRKIGNRP